MQTILLIGGTREARELAGAWRFPALRLVASLAGVTNDPEEYACETRIGGFGGVDGLTEWLHTNGAAAVIDASHPFAEGISANAASAASALALPYLRLQRPEWPPEPNWIMFDTLDGIADALPRGASVLLTTGRGRLAPFIARNDVRFVLRSIESPAPLPAHFTCVTARPPFTEEQEKSLLLEHRISHLVTRNSGGERPAKLAAATACGCEVFCLSMPARGRAGSVSTGEASLTWVETTIDISV